MERAVIKNPVGFAFGLTPVVKKETHVEAGINFAILRLRAHERFDFGSSDEHALLMLSGDATIAFAEQSRRISRHSIFDDAPCALHLSPGHFATIDCHDDCEFALIATTNECEFSSQIIDANTMAENEQRGRGLLDDTAYRQVRTIFDKRNCPSANLVLGEVITLPGRWSSYPPHYHAQPEIYHYRFTEPQGYGHAELGDHVFKISQFDTLIILDERTHAQVSAPGYGMYYLWAIRHLPGRPYTVPTFVDEHAWTMQEGANQRVWRGWKTLDV